jgi:dienelactone hydrolase
MAAIAFAAEQSGPLPQTRLWNFPESIVDDQYRELREFYEKQIREAEPERQAFSRSSFDVQRKLLRELTGAIDRPLKPIGTRTSLGETAQYSVSLVSWPVLPMGAEPSTRGAAGTQVRCYGILLEPKPAGKRAAVIAVPDATQSAADIAGLTTRLPESQQTARRLATAGYVVFSPFFTQRRAFSEPWLDDRIWLMRTGYQTGRHLIGAELIQIESILDFMTTLASVDSVRIGIVGYGQGGMTALYAAALDTRLKAAISAAYLNDPQPDWDQPEDRLVWKLRSHFSNDQIAALVHPRVLHVSPLIDNSALADLAGALAPAPPSPSTGNVKTPGLDLEKLSEIANAQFTQWQAFFRNKALEASDSLQTRWKPDYSSLSEYEKSIRSKREAYFDLIGHYPPTTGPFEAESVQLYNQPGFTGYRLSLRVYDGVHAYGILLVPKGIKPGEKRPVVLVQHGLKGLPESSLGVVPKKEDEIYSQFGLRLAERGYIVFAPMIATQSNPERTRLNRRSQLTGMMPVGMDVKKFDRVLDYLSTLPYVDSRRFAFYGLSYGGYTALWAGPGVSRFQVVISSGHFNDWNAKTTDVTQGTAFPFYANVIDQYDFNMLGNFNHSDLASLVAPRAFMIEIGDFDGVEVAPRSLVDREIDKVLETYRKLGIPDKGAVSRFHGPHMIHGVDTYPFLDRWLNWKPLSTISEVNK